MVLELLDLGDVNGVLLFLLSEDLAIAMPKKRRAPISTAVFLPSQIPIA